MKKEDEVKNSGRGSIMKENKAKRSVKENVEKRIIADNVFRLKEERNITNTEFAQLLGFSVSTICSWEGRTRGITSRTLPRIAEIFNVDIAELFKDNSSYAVKEEDTREAKFKRIRSLLYDFSDTELDCIVDAITSMWKLIYDAENNDENSVRPNKKITYK